MTYRTHLLGGAALAAAAMTYVAPQTTLEVGLYYGMALVGALLPDLDHPNSWVSRKVGILNYPFRALGHRGATHSLLAVLIVFCVMGGVFGGSVATIGLTLGYLSHLLLDMLNPRGVPLFYPLTKDKYKIAKIRTGEWGEYVVVGLLMISVLWTFL